MRLAIQITYLIHALYKKCIIQLFTTLTFTILKSYKIIFSNEKTSVKSQVIEYFFPTKP